jgi:hypothetical protein
LLKIWFHSDRIDNIKKRLEYAKMKYKLDGFHAKMLLLQDVKPFLQAMERFVGTWRTRYGVDILKGPISAPGTAMETMLKRVCRHLIYVCVFFVQLSVVCFMQMPPHTIVPLFNEKNGHWFHDIKKQQVGGPSIVFHRHAKVGYTRIGTSNHDDLNFELVENIIGLDQNSLVCVLSPPILFTVSPPTNIFLFSIWEVFVKICRRDFTSNMNRLRKRSA